MSAHLWDRASALPVPSDGRRRPEVVTLPVGLPTVGELFSFMRDAELRFGTLRMRIEERASTTSGERLTTVDALVRHPGQARVTTSEADLGTRGNYEIWLSDGEVVRTYAARHRLGTERPVRRRIAGLGDRDLPGTSKVYQPLTALPMETLPETFVHPAGLCQNVLATGACSIAGADEVAGREAIVLDCDHPRGTEVWADRPDHRLSIWADRQTGIVTRLVETIGGSVTRDATVVVLEPDAALPPTAFDFEFPPGARFIY